MFPTKKQLTRAINEAVENFKFSRKNADGAMLVTDMHGAFLYWPSQNKIAKIRDRFDGRTISFFVAYPDDIAADSWLASQLKPWNPIK